MAGDKSLRAHAPALTRLDLTRTPEPVEFTAGLFPKRYLSVLAALAGSGKTALLTFLLWQASRPDGGFFLGHRVQPATSIYLDFDAPGGGNILFWLDKHEERYPDGNRNKIIALEPNATTAALTKPVENEIRASIAAEGASILVVDSFMAAFPAVEHNKANAVMGPMTTLRKIATDSNATVIVVDHLPKPMAGETAGARGVLGSVAKTAQARSVHILTRLPKEKVGAAHVLKWEVDKMSFGRRPDPFGIELAFEGNAVNVQPYDLPDEQRETKAGAAQRAMRDHLETQVGSPTPRQHLINIAIEQTGASPRTAENALLDLQRTLGDDLHTIAMPGRGKPTAYKLLTHDLRELAGNSRNTVQEGK